MIDLIRHGFEQYIGIDYSGAETPTSSLKGLRAYETDRQSTPTEVPTPPGPKWYWTRKALAMRLAERLRSDGPTLVGIDHGFSFPLKYFEKHRIPRDWDVFLDDFVAHWPTDGEHMYVDFVRDGSSGTGAARTGSTRWRRITEVRAGAKSVFHFDVPGSVAKSTHAGLPWLRYIRQQTGNRLHFWPFDGWEIPRGVSVVAEVYPSMWSRSFPRMDRTPDQHDAFLVAAWLRSVDLNGSLSSFLEPELTPAEKKIAKFEGWILGVR
jgi:hypothetical protein